MSSNMNMKVVHGFLKRWDPVVPKAWLLVAAGLMWMAVGVMLGCFAYLWLAHSSLQVELLLGGLGIAAGWVIYRYGFSKLAHKNSRRIRALEEKVCVFAFQEWKGYAIIVVMMTGGILLRHSAIPKPYLAVLYAGIGGGLFLSSFHYFQHFYQTVLVKETA
jgi:hypothetical protein